MEIKNLKNIDFNTIFSGFQKAFSDYEIKFEVEEVHSMLKRRGFNPELSFAAFENGEIVAFTLNGTGLFNGIPTAYDTGTGTAPEYRGQGLAKRIFTHSLPFLREAGIRQYLLEVLENNNKAVSVYRQLGFRTTREFNCYRQAVNLIEGIQKDDESCGCHIEPVSTEILEQNPDFIDFTPSWQNSLESIRRGASGLKCLGAFHNGHMAGYCVFDTESGDLTQIAVDPRHRRKGIASCLLKEAASRMESGSIKVLNVDSTCHTLPLFLKSRNIPLANKQFEMTLDL